MSMFEEDGFVMVTKEEVVNSLDEDDVVSISSSRSSLCLVEEPSKESSATAVEEEAPAESAEKETAEVMKRASPTAVEEADKEETSRAHTPVQAVPRDKPKFVCLNCSSDVAAQADLIWEGYMGANKAAFLFSNALNTEASAEPRKQQLSTGLFLLQDVHCRSCAVPLGWSYLKAWSQDQKYKEGATIVQQALLKLEDAQC